VSKKSSTEIKVLLLKKGITQAQIARQERVSIGAVNHVVLGRRKNPRLRKAIARACGVQVEDLWPSQAA
jgi:lambda repressor-like predicted transcriptional regulator